MKGSGLRFYKIFYPGYLSLPDGSGYIFDYDKNRILVSIHAHIDALKIVDATNSIGKKEADNYGLVNVLSEPSQHSFFGQYKMGPAEVTRHFIVDIHNERIFTSRFYTELLLAHEINSSCGKYDDLMDSALSEFIHAYRYTTGDCRVRLPNSLGYDPMLVTATDVEYTDAEKAISLDDRLTTTRELQFGTMFSFKVLETKESVPNTPDAIYANQNKINSFLIQSIAVPDESKMLAKAAEEFDINENYKYTVLECFIIAELAISKALRNLKIKAGVSRKKLDDYETEVGISYKINIELPAFLDALSDKERGIIGEIDRLRKDRNDLMHRGVSPDQSQAVHSLQATTNLLNMLSARNLL